MEPGILSKDLGACRRKRSFLSPVYGRHARSRSAAEQRQKAIHGPNRGIRTRVWLLRLQTADRLREGLRSARACADPTLKGFPGRGRRPGGPRLPPGARGSAGGAFAGLSGGGAAETEIIDQIGYPIGASATSNGVTITADAIVGDTYSYAIVYSIRRDDGEPLVSQEVLESGDNALPLTFDSHDVTPGNPLAVLLGGGGGGYSRFYDADPNDNAIQFMEVWTFSSPIRPGKVTATFQGLYEASEDYLDKELLAEGPWKLEFHMAFEDSSVSLPAGQDFTLNGMDATLDAVTLSPLSIMVEYTVHQEVPQAERENGLEDGENDPYAPFRDLPIVITYTDGTTLEIDSGNTHIGSGSGRAKCSIGLVFDTIRPLDEVASVTVGDIVLPVSTER